MSILSEYSVILSLLLKLSMVPYSLKVSKIFTSYLVNVGNMDRGILPQVLVELESSILDFLPGANAV